MKIYIVIIENHHADTDAMPFLTEAAAISYAKQIALEYCRNEDDYAKGIRNSTIKDGWLWRANYACEGDNIRIIERDVDN
jgi:hypothetical protein